MSGTRREEICPELVGKLAAMCAAENARQRKWIYKFEFYIRWVLVARRPWAGDNLDYIYIIKADTGAGREELEAAIETLKKKIEEDEKA